MFTPKEKKSMAWEIMVARGNLRAASRMLYKRYKLRVDVVQLRVFGESDEGLALIKRQKKAEAKMFQTLQDMLSMTRKPAPTANSSRTPDEQREIDELARLLADAFNQSSTNTKNDPTNPAAVIGPEA